MPAGVGLRPNGTGRWCWKRWWRWQTGSAAARAQVALNWVTHRPGVVATLVGARTVAQLDENLAALDFALPGEHAKRLERAGRPAPQFPFDVVYGRIPAGTDVSIDVRARPAWHNE